jgi:hypothetical protein
MTSSLHSTRLFPKFMGASAYTLTGVASRCDWVILSDEHPPNAILVNRAATTAPRHIFVSLREPFSALHFLEHRVMSRLTEPFVLVSGSEDVTIPRQTDNRWRSFDSGERAIIQGILDHPLLRCWFAENLDESAHPRLRPLPLGMVYPHGAPPAEANTLCPPPQLSRPLRVLCAHRIRPGEQWQSRRDVTCLAKRHWSDWTSILEEEVPDADFTRLIEEHSFVLCVEGGGLDPSPKAWQSLLHGAIPIIRETPVAEAYRNLPVVVVPAWTPESLSLQFLEEWKEKFSPDFDIPARRSAMLQRLTLDYWWARIEAEASTPSLPLRHPSHD